MNRKDPSNWTHRDYKEYRPPDKIPINITYSAKNKDEQWVWAGDWQISPWKYNTKFTNPSTDDSNHPNTMNINDGNQSMPIAANNAKNNKKSQKWKTKKSKLQIHVKQSSLDPKLSHHIRHLNICIFSM